MRALRGARGLLKMLGAAVVILVVGAAIVAIGIGVSRSVFNKATGSGGSNSASLATKIGASSCDNSGFYVQSRLDNSKSTIYDCTMSDGSTKCVTENGGIASDSTAEVKLLFADTLGVDSKPACVT